MRPELPAQQFCTFVIEPVLRWLDAYSRPAARLMLGTALHESMGLTLRDQWTGPGDRTLGPAFGLYQIEPSTHEDIWDSVLRADPRGGGSSGSSAAQRLTAVVRLYQAREPGLHEQLLNPFYATAIARLQYWRWPAPLPEYEDLRGLAHYYKTYFNTAAGKSSPQKWLDDFHRYGGNKVEVSP